MSDPERPSVTPGSDLAKTARQAPPDVRSGARAPRDTRLGAPERPALHNKSAAPVLVKLPPPFFVRLSQLLWIVSLVSGAAAIVYSFVIRKQQLPGIADIVKDVDASRPDEIYTMTADIIFWAVFAGMVVVVFAQILLQVSFAARRPNVRWWQMGTILLFGLIFLLAQQVLTFGERGMPLERIMLIQGALALGGLLVSVLPPALRWTARKHDVRRGGDDSGNSSPAEL